MGKEDAQSNEDEEMAGELRGEGSPAAQSSGVPSKERSQGERPVIGKNKALSVTKGRMPRPGEGRVHRWREARGLKGQSGIRETGSVSGATLFKE